VIKLNTTDSDNVSNKLELGIQGDQEFYLVTNIITVSVIELDHLVSPLLPCY
jgi:hypothetical protein